MDAAFPSIERCALLGAIDQMTVMAENAAGLHLPRVTERVEKPRKEALPLLGKKNDRGGPSLRRWK